MNDTTTPTLARCPWCDGVTRYQRPFGSDCWITCNRISCAACGPTCDTPDKAAAEWNSLCLDVARGKVAAKLAESLLVIVEAAKVTSQNTFHSLADTDYNPDSHFDELTITIGEMRSIVATLAEYDALTTEATK